MLERAPAFEEIGAGLQLGPNAVRALQAIGAWDEVSTIATAPPAILMRDAVSGAVVRRIALAGVFEKMFAGPYRVAHRAHLHAALLHAAQRQSAIRIETGQEVTAVQQDASQVRIAMADGSSRTAGGMIAADGMNSSVRQKLWPESAAMSAGPIMHRTLVDLPQSLPDGDCVNLWMGAGFHVVHYPVGVPARLNIVCVAHAGQTPGGIALLCSEKLQQLFASVPQWLPWEAKHVPALPSWSNGRILLLGDAAHGTVPFFAQGAAMALEDAALLAKLLQEKVSLTDVFAAVNSRIPRLAKVHAASVRQGRIYSAAGPVAVARNIALRLLPERSFLNQLAWLYQH